MTKELPAPAWPAGRIVDLGLAAAAGLVAIAWLVRLAGYAAGAVPGSDECFHAYAGAWIAAHGALPTVLPGLYGGLPYDTPPLLDLIAALETALFGAASLSALPVIFTAGTLAVLALAAGGVPAAARIWAVLLVASSLLASTWAVRLGTEPLAMLCVTAVAAMWLRFEHAPGRATAIGLGVLCGVATWAGPAGWLTFALPAGSAVVRGAARELHARHARLAVGLALLLGLPWLVRNALLFGGLSGAAVLPGIMDESPAAFIARIPAVLGPLATAMLAMAALALVSERRFGRAESLFALAAAGMLGAAFVPGRAARHLVPFVPLLMLGASWVVAQALARRTPLVRPLGAVLLVAAAFFVYRLHDVRAPANPPEALLDAFEEIERLTPEDATVLSLWTCDTAWHAGRAATWPRGARQQRDPLPMFTTEDPARFAAVMDSLRIDHILAPRSAPLEPFHGANYPESFVRCVQTLVGSGDLQLVWGSDRYTLIRRTPGLAAPALENAP